MGANLVDAGQHGSEAPMAVKYSSLEYCLSGWLWLALAWITGDAWMVLFAVLAVICQILALIHLLRGA